METKQDGHLSIYIKKKSWHESSQLVAVTIKDLFWHLIRISEPSWPSIEFVLEPGVLLIDKQGMRMYTVGAEV